MKNWGCVPQPVNDGGELGSRVSDSRAWTLVVLKCRFYFYPAARRPVDWEMVVTKKIVCSRSQEEGTLHVRQGRAGKRQWRSRGRNERKAWAGAILQVFLGRNKWGKISRLHKFKVDWSDYFSSLQGVGTASSGLVPVSGVIMVGDSGWICESSIKEVVGS